MFNYRAGQRTGENIEARFREGLHVLYKGYLPSGGSAGSSILDKVVILTGGN